MRFDRYLPAIAGGTAGKSKAKVAMGTSTRAIAKKAMDLEKAIWRERERENLLEDRE